jgi:hypothetical protein
MAHLGDSHNFGRRVTLRGKRVGKPRTVAWEWLLLSAQSPLRRLLGDAAKEDGLGAAAFGFLPDLRFFGSKGPEGGEVERIDLSPLPQLSADGRRALARIVGRSLALWSWLGVSDLHWENLALGVAPGGRVVFTPLDVELILADLALPTETKLLPDADPEVAAICRHACGVRRVLPHLGKPASGADLVALAGAYLTTLAFLERRSAEVAAVLAALPDLRATPIRVLLRGTDEYVRAAAGGAGALWPPLLRAEEEQLARGDVPYFFRLYGRPGIHYYGDAALTVLRTLPRKGDVPQLDPMLSLSHGLRAPSRRSLREEGLFTVLGAFDHPSFEGEQRADGLAVTFTPRTLAVKLPDGEELRSRRNLRAFVGSVYLPCRCGEVREVLVPAVTTCDAAAPRRTRS